MCRARRCSRRAGRRRRAQAGTITGAVGADPPRGSAECSGSTDDSEDIFLVPGLVHAKLHAAVNLADLEAGGHVPADTAGAAAHARDPDRCAQTEEGPAGQRSYEAGGVDRLHRGPDSGDLGPRPDESAVLE